MKTLITRIFFFILAAVCIAESGVFFLARSRYFSLNSVTSFYSRLLETPRMLDFALGAAIGFLAFGLIFLYLTFRSAGHTKSIVVKGRDGMLRIPVSAIGNFVEQALNILDQYSSLSDFRTTINKKGKWVYISIATAITGGVPVQQEIRRIKGALREEIARVFEFPYFKIDFLVKSVNIEQKKREFGPREELKEEGQITEEMSISVPEKAPDNREMTGVIHLKEEPHNAMPWERVPSDIVK